MSPSRKRKHPQRARPTHAPPPRRQRSKAGWWIAGAIVVAVAIAAIIAISTSGGDTAKVGAGVEQVRSVHVTGDSLPPWPDSGEDPAIGLASPQISGQSFDGTAVTLQSNTPTLIVVVAHWCAFCQREVPKLVSWNEGGGVPNGLQIVGVATSTDGGRPNYPPSEWLKRERFPWPAIADSSESEIGMALGLTKLPYFVLIDAAGKVVMRQSGEIDPVILASQIEAALP